jgi:hypothetical protein
MTPPRTVPTPQHTIRTGLHRRVKRGIVAGYLHGLSPRHRASGAEHESRTHATAPREALGRSPM